MIASKMQLFSFFVLSSGPNVTYVLHNDFQQEFKDHHPEYQWN
jgi:hypothetical protein